MKQEQILEQTLEACISALRSGATREGALASYPELREELEPLLSLAEAVPRAATAAPSERFRTEARARLMATARESTRPGRSSLWELLSPRRMRWASGLVAALLAVVLVGGAGVSVSAEALPGEPLYPVKRIAERAELALALNEQARQTVQLRLIDRRVQEAERLAQRGMAERASEALTAYAEEVEALSVGPAVDQAEQAAELAQRLRERLQEHQARLEQVVEEAPPPARPALEQALERSRRGLERAAEVHELRASGADRETEPETARQPPGRSKAPATKSETQSPKGKPERKGSDGGGERQQSQKESSGAGRNRP